MYPINYVPPAPYFEARYALLVCSIELSKISTICQCLFLWCGWIGLDAGLKLRFQPRCIKAVFQVMLQAEGRSTEGRVSL